MHITRHVEAAISAQRSIISNTPLISDNYFSHSFLPNHASRLLYSELHVDRFDPLRSSFISLHGLDTTFPDSKIAHISSCFPSVTFTILREPSERFLSDIRYQFRRGFVTDEASLLTRVEALPHEYDNVVTRFFSNASLQSNPVNSTHLLQAYSALHSVDFIFNQSNPASIDFLLSWLLSSLRLPNVLSPSKTNISESSDIPKSVSMTLINDLCQKYTSYDKLLHDHFSHSFAVATDLIYLNNWNHSSPNALHPYTAVIYNEESVGSPLKGTVSWRPTSEILGQK